jgi:hypothetical protein
LPSEGLALTGHAETSKPSSDAEIGMQIVQKRENGPFGLDRSGREGNGCGGEFQTVGAPKEQLLNERGAKVSLVQAMPTERLRGNYHGSWEICK